VAEQLGLDESLYEQYNWTGRERVFLPSPLLFPPILLTVLELLIRAASSLRHARIDERAL
ncbi:MAG: hypothetical protein AAGC77_09915, partial [Pseudomonadota bacterium]